LTSWGLGVEMLCEGEAGFESVVFWRRLWEASISCCWKRGRKRWLDMGFHMVGNTARYVARSICFRNRVRHEKSGDAWIL
jgi:hypothetical protein